MQGDSEDENIIGWANLECILYYEELSLDALISIYRDLLNSGFECKALSYSSGVAHEYIEEVGLKEVGELVANLVAAPMNVTFYLAGRLFDTTVDLSVVIDIENGCIEIATLEDFIWNYSNYPADARIERMEAFADVCRSICSIRRPMFASVGTEGSSPDANTIWHLRSTGGGQETADKVLSQRQIQDLFDWYINDYVPS